MYTHTHAYTESVSAPNASILEEYEPGERERESERNSLAHVILPDTLDTTLITNAVVGVFNETKGMCRNRHRRVNNS